MISQKHSFILVHIPKTAGNSLHDTLRNYIDDSIICNSAQDGYDRFGIRNESYPQLCKHSRLSEYYQCLGESIHDFKIYATIRNPFDKMISCYFSPHRWDSGNTEPFWDEILFNKMIKQTPSLEWYLNVTSLNINIRYLKYESIKDDFNSMCEEVGLPKLTLSHRNRSKRNRNYYDYYDEDMINIIKQKHSYEISLGNYQY